MKPPITVYSKIISGEVPAAIIAEDEHTIAFLDHHPLTKGHTLVIPKEPIDHLDHCSPELYQAVFTMVHRVSKLLKQKLDPERVGLVVHGYEIPHAHVHVIPIYSRSDLKFPERSDDVNSPEQLTKVLQKLKV